MPLFGASMFNRKKGDRRDSNPRRPGPQPGALPTELRPPLDILFLSTIRQESIRLLRSNRQKTHTCVGLIDDKVCAANQVVSILLTQFPENSTVVYMNRG